VFESQSPIPFQAMGSVKKKKFGRTLEGRTWDETWATHPLTVLRLWFASPATPCFTGHFGERITKPANPPPDRPYPFEKKISTESLQG